jgi:hypothetical protein
MKNLYSKEDLIFLAIVPFSITILFGDDFPKYAGENYELLRFISIVALTFFTITYIKRVMLEKEMELFEQFDRLIEDTKKMNDIYLVTYNGYKEDQKICKDLKEAYDEQYRLINERIAKLEEEMKK